MIQSPKRVLSMKTAPTQSRLRSLIDFARQDDGMALGTVMAISAILFLLATTLVMLASQQQVSASNQVTRTKALHAADAGINAYLYKLSVDYYAWQSSPVATGTTSDGTWSVTATRPGGTGPITLNAVGTVPGATRRVIANVQAPTFADYTLLFNESINIGAAAVIKGNVRSNVNIANAGEITGQAVAVGTVSGSGQFDGGRYPNSRTQSFAVVDYGGLLATATAAGTYWGNSGTYLQGATNVHYLGYDVILNGTGGTIQKVKAYNSTTGTMTLDPTVTAFTVPACGIIYFDDAVWLHGTYAAKVTVVVGSDYEDTSGNQAAGPTTINNTTWTNPTSGTYVGQQMVNSSVFIDDNLQPDDINSDHVCGIVTKGDISITECASDAQNNEICTAALLSTAGAVHADWITNIHKNHFQLNGSIAQWQAGYFLSGSSTGYLSRDYWFDSRLYTTPPPLFPPLGDGTLKVNSWVEN
jgi:hypothetical protein